MKLKKNIALVILCLLSYQSFGIALGDWQNTTPGGNSMSDQGNGTWLLIKKNNKSVFPIKEWYFYKGYIIGKSEIDFFVVDEHSGSITRFQNESHWDGFIKRNNLIPLLWTRWYSDNWKAIDTIVILMVFGFFVSIPLLLFFLWALYKALIKEHFNLRKPFSKIVFAIIVTSSVMIMLDYYPTSI